MIRAFINVSLKEDVMDPQGNAVGQALLNLGHKSVRKVRVGRYFEVLLEGDDLETAREDVRRMCEELLANMVIERYRITVEAVPAAAAH